MWLFCATSKGSIPIYTLPWLARHLMMNKTSNTSRASARGGVTTPSILDRLLDDKPRDAVEGPHAALFDVRAYKAAVARDLETLLNTRCVDPDELIETYPEARTSVVAYGISDLSSLSLLNPDDRATLRDRIRITIERFEPRLSKVKVALESPRDFDRMLRFRVDAVLAGHPSRPPIVLDAWLQLSSNQYGFVEKT